MGIPRVSQAGCPPHTTAIGEGKISTSCVQCGVKQKSVFSKRGPWDSLVKGRPMLLCGTCQHTAPGPTRANTGSPGLCRGSDMSWYTRGLSA